jgi:hypothetical protein
MKQFQKITAILLATMILVGTTGFKVEKFYCGTYLKSIHVFTSPTPCCLETNTTEGKCRTEKEFIKAEVNGDLPVLSQKIELPVFSSSIFTQAINQALSTQSDLSPTKYLNYKPPLLLRNIPIITQSFLI